MLGIFKTSIRLNDRCFYVTITGNFEHFQYFNFETNFLKNTYFLKSFQMQHFHTRLLCQKPLLRQSKWRVQQWTYNKERSFDIYYFIFLNNLVKRVDLKYQPQKCPYSYFLKALERWSFIWGCFFPMSILKIGLLASLAVTS